MLLVGYNDAEQYFTLKNSWSPAWGEQGFFRIAYSEMDSVVDFGLSTIAYRAAKDEAPVGEAVLAPMASMFKGLASWK